MDLLQRVLDRLGDAYWWVAHRTFDRYDIVHCHGLTSRYHDTDTRMFAAMFSLLKDYVEVELANMDLIVSEEQAPILHRIPLISHFFKYRNPARGLAYLKRDQEPSQWTNQESIDSAKEVEYLYRWYVGKRFVHDSLDESFFDSEEMPKEKSKKFLSNLSAWWGRLKESEEAETEMLIRLVKIRTHLWT